MNVMSNQQYNNNRELRIDQKKNTISKGHFFVGHPVDDFKVKIFNKH